MSTIYYILYRMVVSKNALIIQDDSDITDLFACCDPSIIRDRGYSDLFSICHSLTVPAVFHLHPLMKGKMDLPSLHLCCGCILNADFIFSPLLSSLLVDALSFPPIAFLPAITFTSHLPEVLRSLVLNPARF